MSWLCYNDEFVVYFRFLDNSEHKMQLLCKIVAYISFLFVFFLN